MFLTQTCLLCFCARARTCVCELSSESSDLHHRFVPQAVLLTKLGGAAGKFTRTNGTCKSRANISAPSNQRCQHQTVTKLSDSASPFLTRARRTKISLPSSTMRSPSRREAPRPAHSLLIWVIRARRWESLEFSSSLPAGLSKE